MQNTKLLNINEVACLLPPDLPMVDKETNENLRSFRLKMMERRIKAMNQNIDEIMDIWPDATPQMLYIAFELSNDDVCRLLENKLRPAFTRQVQRTLSKRINDHYKGEESGKRDRRQEWDEDELDQFIELCETITNDKGFCMIASKLGTRKPRECQEMYVRLVHEGLINNRGYLFDIKESSKKATFQSLTFVFEGSRFVLGPKPCKYGVIGANPFPKGIDMITQQEIRQPYLSPDGYVLNYSTWLRIINDKKPNPFTGKKIPTKRALIPLTSENVDYYRAKIINMDALEPN